MDDDGRDDRRRSGPGLSFSLPAITLPPVRLPERFFAFLPPKMRRRERESGLLSRVVLALLVDLADLWLALSGATFLADLVRTGTGTALALVLTGGIGALYAWEVVAVVLSVSMLTAVPTATPLVLARALRERLRGRHPEEVDRVAETEGEDPGDDQRRPDVGHAVAAETDEAREQ